MEFRCPHCEHIGPAAEVRPGESGVEVVCESCAEPSPLEADGEDDATDDGVDESGELPDVPSTRSLEQREPLDDGIDTSGEISDIPSKRSIERQLDDDTSSGAGAAGRRNVASIPEDVIEELVPDPEADRRCPKCATPVPSPRQEHCVDCGLSLEEAQSYEEGQAPWEQPEPGQQQAFEEARDLWERAVGEHTEEAFEAFVEHVRDHTLFGLGIRKLRFHLVDHPDDEMAIEALRSMASGMEAKIVAARAEAEADAEQLQEEISRYKRFMAGAVLVLWVVAMILFADLFLGWNVL